MRTLLKTSDVPIRDTKLIAQNIAKELGSREWFCLWLIGEIGSGKTFMTREILRALGYPPSVPVTSPTFTYLNDYEVNGKRFGHLDFYRADANLPLALNILDDYDFDGLFVEWPEKVEKTEARIRPTHILELRKSNDLSTRDYIFLCTEEAR